MSTQSQPIQYNSKSESSFCQDGFQPKYNIDSDDEKLNSAADYQSNRLPLNLFHSAAEYNKMLITYGKNRTKDRSQIAEGVITNLEFVNDKIFEHEIQKRAEAKQKLNTNKPAAKETLNCLKNSFHKEKAELPDSIRKIKETIDHEIQQARIKASKNSQVRIPKKRNSTNRRTIDVSHQRANSESRRANSATGSLRPVLNQSSIENASNSRKSASRADIEPLLMKSLLQFEEQKKIGKMIEIANINKKQAKQQYLRDLDQRIRLTNLERSRNSLPKKKKNEISKHDVALKYWEQVREEVLESIKTDNYSKSLKSELKNYNFEVYEHRQLPKKQRQHSEEMVEALRRKHEIEALEMKQAKAAEEKIQRKSIERNLRQLEAARLERIRSCEKRPFKPTAELIHGAFKNIIEPRTQEVISSAAAKSQEANKATLANHQKIKKGTKRKEDKKGPKQGNHK